MSLFITEIINSLIFINMIVDKIRYANEKFSSHGFNVIEVTIKREGKKCIIMHLNAGGLLVALKEDVIVRFEKPNKKDTESFLSQIKLLSLSEEEERLLLKKLPEMVEEQYQEYFKEALL